jgi:hypothetical protein
MSSTISARKPTGFARKGTDEIRLYRAGAHVPQQRQANGPATAIHGRSKASPAMEAEGPQGPQILVVLGLLWRLNLALGHDNTPAYPRQS